MEGPSQSYEIGGIRVSFITIFAFSGLVLLSLGVFLFVKLRKIKKYEQTKRKPVAFAPNAAYQLLEEDNWDTIRLQNIEANKLLMQRIQPEERVLWVHEQPSYYVRTILGFAIGSAGAALLGIVASITSYILQPPREIDYYIIIVYGFLFIVWLVCVLISLIRRPTSHAAYALTNQRAFIIGLSRPSCFSSRVEEELLVYEYPQLHSVKVERTKGDEGSILFKTDLVGELSIATGFFDIPDVDSVAALIKQQVVNNKLKN